MARQYGEDRGFDWIVCANREAVIRGSVLVGRVPCISVRVLEESVGAQVAAEDVDNALMVGALIGVGHIG